MSRPQLNGYGNVRFESRCSKTVTFRAANSRPYNRSAAKPYLLLLLVLWSEYCLMEEILLSDSVMKAFSFSSNS